ncbi:MAG: tetratricopeptide repeat protein [Methylococcus sp.]|nr:tetratricopeptide repeat protein [Methylococcus sp.]
MSALTERGSRRSADLASLLENACALAAAGDSSAAEAAFAAILRQSPASAEALHGLGRLQGMRGEWALAGQNLAKAVQLRPEFAEAWVDLGNVHQMSGSLEDAMAAYRRALTADDTNALAWCNLGICQQKRTELAEASSSFRRALELNPRFGLALRHWVSLQEMLAWPKDAHDLLERRARAAPDDGEIQAALGFMLLKHGFRPAEAVAHFDRALALGATGAELHGNRGIALQDLGRIDDALAAYETALALEPENRSVRFHRALARLLVHDFENAWADYELRLLSEDHPRRAFPYPRWDGSGLSGKTILVYAEQGLGDEIMFASCLPDVVARAGHCVIECNEKLAPIFRRSFPTATVHGGSQHDDQAWLSQMSPIDCCTPIGSLPLYFRNRLADFPSHDGYLKADEERVAHWRQVLESLGPGLKVGISWRGGTCQTRQSYRSLPLESLAPILEVDGTHFVNLQYGECRQEIAKLQAAQDLTVHDFPEAIADYDETAALVTALDLVISVCTAAVQLAGALGRPVWVLAPAGPEWPFGIVECPMPWHPSCRVFRQSAPLAWEDVVFRVRNELIACLDEN